MATPSARIKIRGYIKNLPSGSRKFDLDIVNASSNFETSAKELNAGSNVFTKPDNSIGFIFVPPVGGTSTKTLKGVTGDTGVRLGTQPSVFVMGTQSTVDIYSSGSESVETVLVWF